MTLHSAFWEKTPSPFLLFLASSGACQPLPSSQYPFQPCFLCGAIKIFLHFFAKENRGSLYMHPHGRKLAGRGHLNRLCSMNRSSPSRRGKRAFWTRGTAFVNLTKLFSFYHTLKMLNLKSAPRPHLGDSGQFADPGLGIGPRCYREHEQKRCLWVLAAWQHTVPWEEGEGGSPLSGGRRRRQTPLAWPENSPGACGGRGGIVLARGCTHIRACPAGNSRFLGRWEFPSTPRTLGQAGEGQVLPPAGCVSPGSHFLSLCLPQTRGNRNAHGGRVQCRACSSAAPGQIPEGGGSEGACLALSLTPSPVS